MDAFQLTSSFCGLGKDVAITPRISDPARLNLSRLSVL